MDPSYFPLTCAHSKLLEALHITGKDDALAPAPPAEHTTRKTTTPDQGLQHKAVTDASGNDGEVAVAVAHVEHNRNWPHATSERESFMMNTPQCLARKGMSGLMPSFMQIGRQHRLAVGHYEWLKEQLCDPKNNGATPEIFDHLKDDAYLIEQTASDARSASMYDLCR